MEKMDDVAQGNGKENRMDIMDEARRIAGKTQPPPLMAEPTAQYAQQYAQPGQNAYAAQSATLPETWTRHVFIDPNDRNIRWVAINRRNCRKKLFDRIGKLLIALPIILFLFVEIWGGWEFHLHVDGFSLKIWSDIVAREDAREQFIKEHHDELNNYYDEMGVTYDG